MDKSSIIHATVSQIVKGQGQLKKWFKINK